MDRAATAPRLVFWPIPIVGSGFHFDVWRLHGENHGHRWRVLQVHRRSQEAFGVVRFEPWSSARGLGRGDLEMVRRHRKRRGPDRMERRGAGHAMVSAELGELHDQLDRKSTRLNSSHSQISYAVFCLKKKKKKK